MKTIRITFADFWDNNIPNDNYFYNLLSLKYNVIIDDINPDIVFCSCYGSSHFRFDKSKVIKVLYLGENMRPDFNTFDYSFSFDRIDDERNYRLPLWSLLFNWFNRPYRSERDHAYLHEMENFLDRTKIQPTKTKFCSFVASQPKGMRVPFVPRIYQYKHIDCAGAVYNNYPRIPGRGDEAHKINFLRDYKFNICFENSSHVGYTTEKIIHSMFSNCIPIYWGDPSVSEDFNPNSFLNWNEFGDSDKLIERVIEIDNDPKLYEEYLNQPWFKDNKIPDFIKPDSVMVFMDKIISNI
jgi:hypothetical protein